MNLKHIKQLFVSGTDRAVSPVIGVILMVAITVILAAVIGTFVLGLGSGVQSTPAASFSWDLESGADTNDTLTITHNGGDKIESSALSVNVQDYAVGDIDTKYSNSSVSVFADVSNVGAGDNDEINATRLGVDGALSNSRQLHMNESSVKLVFERSDQPETAILAEFEGPDA